MDYLKFKREFRYGCIVVDFITPELSRAIYLQNFN